MFRSTPTLLALLWLALATAACGTGAVGRAVAGKAPSAADALDEPALDPATIDCSSLGRARPLVVDWGSQDRLDLELTMRDRVAVVHYGCDGLRLLPSCTLAGSYRFAGVSRKEEMVQLTSADELAANLPFSAVKLQAEMKRGSAIDLALVMVGKHVTSVREGPRVLLEGECEGATHFVHSAYVGAFAMDRGTKGKARSLVDVFGRGGEASSSYQARRASKDGEVDACRGSKSADPRPPEQCASTLRIELYPLIDGGKPAGKKSEAKEDLDEPACPEGMVEHDGICTRPKEPEDRSCPKSNVKACRMRCDEGDAESCYRLAKLHFYGTGLERSFTKPIPLVLEACEGGVLPACTAFYDVSVYCENDAKRNQRDASHCMVGRRIPIVESACEKGAGKSCLLLANLASGSDDARWRRYMRRACDLGNGGACSRFAEAQLEGHHDVPTDVPAALETLERGCQGGEFMSCVTLFKVYDEGKHGVASDPERATTYEAQLCAQENAIGACMIVAKRYRDAPPGISRDRDKAIRFFRHACSLKLNPLAGEGCYALAEMLRFSGGRLSEKEKKEAVESYFEACRLSGEGCDFAITLTKQRAFRHDKQACVDGKADACERLGVTLADEGCRHEKPRQCKQLGAHAPSRLRGHCITSGKVDSVACEAWRKQGGEVPAFPASPSR